MISNILNNIKILNTRINNIELLLNLLSPVGLIAIDHGGVIDAVGYLLPKNAASISEIEEVFSYIPNAEALLKILTKLEKNGFIITFASSNSEKDQLNIWNALVTFANTNKLHIPKISALVTNKPLNTSNETIPVLKPINNENGKKFIRDTLLNYFKMDSKFCHFIDDGPSNIDSARNEKWNAYLIESSNDLVNILTSILDKYIKSR